MINPNMSSTKRIIGACDTEGQTALRYSTPSTAAMVPAQRYAINATQPMTADKVLVVVCINTFKVPPFMGNAVTTSPYTSFKQYTVSNTTKYDTGAQTPAAAYVTPVQISPPALSSSIHRALVPNASRVSF
jgi:hypothetical protein